MAINNASGVKSFLDQTGLSYFWSKILNRIANIQPADIGAQPKIIATGILYSDGTGTITAKETVSATVLEVGANKWLGTNTSGDVVAKDLPSASTDVKGTTYLVDSYTSTSTDAAVTPKALNSVYKMIPEGAIPESVIQSIIAGTYSSMNNS